MPFINVKVAGGPLEQSQVSQLQKGITSLMAEVLHKVGPLVGVLIEQVPSAGWSVGGKPVKRAAQVDATVSAGTNSAEEKVRFIAEASRLLKSVLGPDLSEVTYVVVHDVPKDSWVTMASRRSIARTSAAQLDGIGLVLRRGPLKARLFGALLEQLLAMAP